MDTLRVHMFGMLQVHRGERCLDRFPTLKARHLFCFLLLHRSRLHSRDVIAGLFWGDVAEEQARKSLRTTLWRLRTFLDNECTEKGKYLLIENDEIGFNCSADYWLDVEEFERNANCPSSLGTKELNAQQRSALTKAAELYRGDILEGCYEDWCLFDRERLQSMFLHLLTRLMIDYREQGDYNEAIALGQRILNCDPLLEEVHRELIRLHWGAGNRGSALRQYRMCSDVLKREFDIEPMEETQALYRQICNRKQAPEHGRPLDAQSRGEATQSGAPLGSGSETRPSLALRVQEAIGDLCQVRTELQDLSVRFCRGVGVLEDIQKELCGIAQIKQHSL